MKNTIAHDVGNTYNECRQIIAAINYNCKVDNENPIPLKFYMLGGRWMIECLNPCDNDRLEKQLNYIYNN